MNIYIKKVTRSLGAFRKYFNITKLKRGLYHSHTTLYGRPASHAFLIYIFTYPAYSNNFICKKSTCSLGAFRKYFNITKLKRGLYHSHTTLYGRPASHAFLIYIFTYPAYSNNFICKKSTCSLGAFRKYFNITKLKRGLYHSHTTLYGRPASHAFLIYIFTYPAYSNNFICKKKARAAWELLDNILISQNYLIIIQPKLS